ncbi:MAG: hypothetical protein JWM34_3432 [Ilumatobacteraceae bacterium]|nr:hypothetical protein [Ilumatobacteraceae bacterium]
MRRILAATLIASSSLAIAVATSVSPTSAAVPGGFADITVPASAANPLSGPTGISAMADGRALITERTGALRILAANGTLVDADALTLSVCTDSEEGLLSAVEDPAFASNGFIYAYYTANLGNCASSTGRFNRVSRFHMTGNTVDPVSELVLLDKMNIPAGNHNGGDLHFGADGYLYVSVGDGGTNPRGSGPSAAQDLSLLNGKIMRIGTTPHVVPADNPFVGQAGAKDCSDTGISTTKGVDVCTQIYAYGLRNPYRFAFDPNSGNTSFFIDDVGDGTWEEVDHAVKGANYGWDDREGFCPRGVSTNCTPPDPSKGFTDPLTAYNHNIGCNYITAGVFVPNGIWPADYDDSYLFADGGCGRMWRRTPAGAVDYDTPFAATSGVIVDMAFVKQGTAEPLYYVTNSTSQIHKITYNAGAPRFTGTPSNVTATAPVGQTHVAVTFPLPAASDSGGALTPTCSPASGTQFNVGATTVTCTATNGAGSATTTFTVTVAAHPATTPDFVPTTPFRLADTRAGFATGDGLYAGGGSLASGAVLQLRVSSRGGVAADAGSVALNVTSVNSAADGFVTVFPCGAPQPLASSLNFTSGATASNAVVTKIGTDGNVCILASQSMDLVVDAAGWFPTESTLVATSPARLLDTRAGHTTVDGQQQAGGLPASGSVTVVKVAGRAGVAADARSAVLNVTATDATAPGYVTVYPCGTTTPTASNLNVGTGGTAAALAISKIAADGTVCIFVQSATHLVVDVDGSFSTTTTYAALTPARLFDSRPGFATVDGQAAGAGALAPGTVTTVQVTGRGGVPAAASAATLNVTVTNPAANGFVAVYPCGGPVPLASNVNFATGQTVADAALVRLASNGTVCIYNSQPTDLVVDVAGSFP